jgi:hypothetical protein
MGDDADRGAGQAGSTLDQQPRGVNQVRSHTYEITFTGEAGTAVRAEFDDCEVNVGSGTTTLRAELPDQAALCGLVLRITGLGLDVLDMHRVAPRPDD